MTLDFDLLKKRLATLQGQNSRSLAILKLKPGKTILRIVPWKERPEFPFIELYFHYLGGRTYLSPITQGKPDPIQEFADKLAMSGNKDEWQMAKKFRPKLRTFVPVIVRGEEEMGVRFWGFGITVYKKLATILDDEDWGDITHPETGRDIVVEFTPGDEDRTKFATTEVTVKPNQTKLTENPELLKKWLTVQPDIYEVFPLPTYEELAAHLERYLNPGVDTSVTVETKTPSQVATAVEAATTAETENSADEKKQQKEESSELDDVALEFEKLFNQ
jgi:hypothetical protein